MEDRLVELETKLTFQDELIHELNDVVSEQQQKLEAHQRELDSLSRRVNLLSALLVAAEDTVARARPM